MNGEALVSQETQILKKNNQSIRYFTRSKKIPIIELRKSAIGNIETLCLGPVATRHYFRRKDIDSYTIEKSVDSNIDAYLLANKDAGENVKYQFYSDSNKHKTFESAQDFVTSESIKQIGIYWPPYIYSAELQIKWTNWAKSHVFSNNEAHAEIAVEKALFRLESNCNNCVAVNLLAVMKFINQIMRNSIIDEARRMNILPNMKPPLVIKTKGIIWCKIWEDLYVKKMNNIEVISNYTIDVRGIICEIRQITENVKRRFPKDGAGSLLSLENYPSAESEQKELLLFVVALLLKNKNRVHAEILEIPMIFFDSLRFNSTEDFLKWYFQLVETLAFTKHDHAFLHEYFVNNISLQAMSKLPYWKNYPSYKLRYLKMKLLNRLSSALSLGNI